MTLKVAHLLRKYDPSEWGGTETVIHQLLQGWRDGGIESVVYCPELPRRPAGPDPLEEAGGTVRRFRACVPVWGIAEERRRQLVAVGGNLMSFDLIPALWREPGVDLIHAHALGRVGGIGLTVARRRRLPFVVTVHGGLYDLPAALRRPAPAAGPRGWEWGKAFGWLLRARAVVTEADAVLTCNPREADLIRARHPGLRVIVQPHGVPAARYAVDQRAVARAAFPAMAGREVVLAVGRIDAVKNQGWLVEHLTILRARHPGALLVLAGACTDEAYGRALEQRIAELGLGPHVLLTGRLPPGDPRLVGLLQEARVVVLPSVSETFGLVILEAWAAGTPVVSSRTSGAEALIVPGETGWLFDLAQPAGFLAAMSDALESPARRERVVAATAARVRDEFDARVVARRMADLYGELTEDSHALRGPAG